MLKDYKFGLSMRIPDSKYRTIGVCLCGQHILGSRFVQTDFECNNCGNNEFIMHRKNSTRFIVPYLQLNKKSSRGFDITRVNLSVTYVDGFLKIVRENLKRRVVYDIADQYLKVYRNGELELDKGKDDSTGDVANVSSNFFSSLEINDFFDKVSDDTTNDMYLFIKRLSDRTKGKVFTALIDFMKNYSWMQVLVNSGIRNVNDLVSLYRYRWNRNRRNSDTINTNATRPHEILRLPRVVIPFLRRDGNFSVNSIQSLQDYICQFDNNTIKEILTIVEEESNILGLATSIETISSLYNNYNYKNITRLITYLFRDVKIRQGISSPSNAANLLSDYARMSKVMGIKWKRYPKSLKREHDVVSMNYSVNHDEHKEKEFEIAVNNNSYQDLSFKGDKFSIVAPSSIDDVVNEGRKLSHCVGSYVNDIINERCKILFMRNSKNEELPLVTIEVRGSNIRQAHGLGNRSVHDDEKEFIKKWSKEKRLHEAYY